MDALFRSFFPLALTLALSACGDTATLPDQSSFGANPTLPEPVHDVIPTINIAAAKGWPAGATPAPAPGLGVNAFASGLDHPRWLYVLPNGDVLVAETNGPTRPEDRKGITGWISKMAQQRAGAAVPSANRITLLRDAQGRGVADMREIFLQGLNSPFGMALVGDSFYVADTDAILRFPYKDGDTKITAKGEKIADLPAGPINHHWTKNLIASPDGSRLYVTVGSNSNAAENGLDKEVHRAAILEIDLAARQSRVFASGLRNPNGMMWEPDTGALWTVVNERDELGGDLVPDYLTSVRENGFYGWPFSYYGQHVDERVKPQRPDLVATAIPPDYAIGNHTASLGLAFSSTNSLPAEFRHGAFIGQHGSWNRSPFSGYKVIFIPFAEGRPSGPPRDVLSGFINPAEDVAYGRPVGVAFDKSGALLVADDVGNCVWRVNAEAPQGRSASKGPLSEPAVHIR
ncbi:PQQ-dependent sugar dehydrogenase [Methylocapsa palsarum]|uniref:Glucose/arabinose dehydrogenase, beta-propeller fold n=1 Tax=Methylocapsa palsarum TaxID=1612308 RepID=A0A1I3W0H6_9HYPH|nr:sorbosone dehydrogenase family protein [Methylocapsa palsarum]SFK00930.1 Glucose/arabinose dehydrogenase, beta-propeller fold [Methylocapsa palsarum]